MALIFSDQKERSKMKNRQDECTKRGALTRRQLMGASLLGAGLGGSAITPLEAASNHGCQPAKPIADALREKNILIRYMSYPGYGEGLRISVGTDPEIDRLLTALREIL